MYQWHRALTVPLLRRALQHRALPVSTKRDGSGPLVPMRKADMQRSITRHDAARRVQRSWRSRGCDPTNTEDVITLQVIWRRRADAEQLFSFFARSGKRLVYSPASLALYVANGASCDPLTRESYTCTDICRLAAQSGVALPLPTILHDLLEEFARFNKFAAAETKAIENLFFQFAPCLRMSFEMLEYTALEAAAVVTRLRSYGRDAGQRGWHCMQSTLETLARVIAQMGAV